MSSDPQGAVASASPTLVLTCELHQSDSHFGRVLDGEGLRAHAAEVAKAHGPSRVSRLAGPLPGRFRATAETIERAYEVLCKRSGPHVEAAAAEEWLLDNRYVVLDQIREAGTHLPRGYLRKLPRIIRGPSARYPRVYSLSVDYLVHTDGRLDPESLAAYVDGYQTVYPLTIGELWAIPIMLRLGLLAVLAAAASEVTRETGRARAIEASRRLVENPEQGSRVLSAMEREGIDAHLLVHLWKTLREREATSHALEWIREHAAALGASPEDLSHRINLSQAATHLAVANAVASMRTLSAYEWSQFFERSSVVERILGADRGGVFAATDRTSRDRYRHTVERVALRSSLEEAEVAKKALLLAQAHAEGARSHVGYFLGQEGVDALERATGARLTIAERAARIITGHPRSFYFPLVFLLTLLATAALWVALAATGLSSLARVVLTGLLALSASEIALSVTGAIVVTVLPPRLLSRLSLDDGITAAHRTLVAVPVLFDSPETVDALFAQLEVRALANPDPNLHFALLSDFCDATTEHAQNDAKLVTRAMAALDALNARYPLPSGLPKYALFHRKRIHNPSEACFMGWERKRGKLEELNRLIVGAGKTSFTVVTAPKALLTSIQYVIALDADTDLPRTAATHLVATIAHPINRPVLSPDRSRVTEGYTIIQPRIGTVPSSARRSRFAYASAGPAALDPYTTAVSDVYQDLFGEGSYVGKAIYDVRAFSAVHDGKTPDNRLLSHDLFEGILARTALASDIELLDEQPSSYGVVARRAHRWMRGDWQLVSLVGLSPRTSHVDKVRWLGLVGLWKVADNLRRTLVGPASVLALALSFLLWPSAGDVTTSVVIGLLFAPVVLRLLATVLRHVRSRASYDGLWRDLRTTVVNAALATLVFFDQAVVAVDAMARTLYRLAISKKRLLEWQSTSLDRAGAKTPVRMWPLSLVTGALVVAATMAHGVRPAPLAIFSLWTLAPAILHWLGRPQATVDRTAQLTPEARLVLRGVARRTWHFFETFVTAEDNFLPPDNFQEEPRAVVAHRTSPTNIGLYLLTTVAARDLGYITTRALVERLTSTLDTLDRLEKHEGHILNWYDTKTEKPLEPRYVSTVDSGNLAAHLWAVSRACEELITAPVLNREAVHAIDDAVRLAGGEVTRGPEGPDLYAVLGEIERAPSPPGTGEWQRVAADTRDAWRAEILAIAPHLVVLSDPPEALVSLAPFLTLEKALTAANNLTAIANTESHVHDARAALEGANLAPDVRAWLSDLFDRVARGAPAAAKLAESLRHVGERAAELAAGMHFGFLYDADRSLFSIGYNVSTARLDGSRYDLLASEARLASFVAIAKGDVPEKHWFHLGRARRRVDSEAVLVSWTGSMFEYLMPLLVMRSYPDTLLDETHAGAVKAHRHYCKRHNVPWGISESAFNVMDLSMTYQYRAFGVPAIGLKPGLDEDLVVAPYATGLAAMIEPNLAAENYEALHEAGVRGRYGFYDAIDYTPSRVPPNRRGVPVKTYMAHHQAMTTVALTNVLLGSPMQRRFHELPRVKATELLLQERIPSAVPSAEEPAARAPASASAGEDFSVVDVVGLEPQGATRMHLLGHGELATIVSSVGTGVLTWRGLDVGRYREDQRLDPAGTFLYVRDVASGDAWSAALEPMRVPADAYGATFSVDHVQIHRKDRGIETTTEVVVSPEHAVEVRRVTLTNHTHTAREVELTTYMEVVLAPRTADVAHRAFGNLFIETEFEESLGAVIATRRKQPGDSASAWLVQTLVPETGVWGALSTSSSRAAFLGRGGDVTAPRKAQTALAPVVRYPLDPAIVLRRTVKLAPKATARISLVTGIAASRDEVAELAHAYAGSAILDRVFELAWADARVELKHLGVSAVQSFRFQRLLSFILSPHPALRVAPPDPILAGDGRSALWSLGISGDLPLVIVRADDAEGTDLCREVLLAHEFFRLNNFAFDLLLWNEEPAGYLQPAQDALTALVQSSFAQGQLDQRGGIFVRRASAVDPHNRGIILSSARVVLKTSGGSLTRQLSVGDAAAAAAPTRPHNTPITALPALPELIFDNKTGGFTEDGREYVVYGDTPAPWSNVLANESFGALVTERGGGYTWSTNSQRFRLSPWSNDAASDPAGEAIYLSDAPGEVWLATSGMVRHGADGSTFEGRTRGVHHTLTITVPPNAPVKLSKLVVENETSQPIVLRVCGYVEWVLGSSREASRLTLATAWDAGLHTVFAQNAASPLGERCSFFRATAPVVRMTADRAEVFDAYTTRRSPNGPLSGRVGGAVDPCAALEVEVKLLPSEKKTLAFVLGDGKDRAEARSLAEAWNSVDAVDGGISQARSFWDEVTGAIQVQTPDPALDLMVNRWLLHQVLACRVWGRSAFYQSGGAFGFRDQLQDVLALLHTRPDLARKHLLVAARRQFEEGDVQHWWHPEDGAGIRTRCSDDMLWLPFTTTEYVRVTGDASVLDEKVPFLTDRPIPPDQRDVFASPRVSEGEASLYEHCVRAVNQGFTSGPHGLPLMRGGDWNDGMDHVGAGGKGESVWLAWFGIAVAKGLARLASARGDTAHAEQLEGKARLFGAAIEEHGWDGAWYRRGYFDDGSVLGSHESTECQIDAIAQAWAVIAGGTRQDRAREAIGEAEARLVKTDPPIMQLLTPPFDGKGPDPGYIKAYPPGIRENGGQYTHGVLWTVQALAMLGEGERAYALMTKLCPIRHAETPEGVARYAVEPYVLAGDVYSSPEHDGRGGWSWYTGAAGWMYRIAVEWILGVQVEGDRLTLRPCVPSSWGRYGVRLRHGSSFYEISVEPGGALHIELDGSPVEGASLEMVDDGRTHRVVVRRERFGQAAE